MSIRSKGICQYCGKEYTKSFMMKHLTNCKERTSIIDAKANEKATTGFFSIAVSGKYSKEYWLLIEIEEDLSLYDLDCFLRDIWLECCGHLSTFKINGVFYDMAPLETMKLMESKNSMNIELKHILAKGMQFEHEYDFGSTTTLTLKVFTYRIGNRQKDNLMIMSRNKPIEILCTECDVKPATMICSDCSYSTEFFLCENCKDEHECGKEMLIKIANSPRCGVCAYDGSSKYQD